VSWLHLTPPYRIPNFSARDLWNLTDALQRLLSRADVVGLGDMPVDPYVHWLRIRPLVSWLIRCAPIVPSVASAAAGTSECHPVRPGTHPLVSKVRSGERPRYKGGHLTLHPPHPQDKITSLRPNVIMTVDHVAAQAAR
jgi:hypothetical protein